MQGLKIFGLVTLLTGLACLPAGSQILDRPIPQDPVTITGGRVSGNLLPSGVKAYLGIPFAAPPVGDLRWKAPQPVIPWNGVRYTLNRPPACMQTGISE